MCDEEAVRAKDGPTEPSSFHLLFVALLHASQACGISAEGQP